MNVGFRVHWKTDFCSKDQMIGEIATVIYTFLSEGRSGSS